MKVDAISLQFFFYESTNSKMFVVLNLTFPPFMQVSQ